MYGVFIGGVCAFIVLLIVVVGALPAAIVVAAAVLVAALALRPAWSLYIALVLGLTAFPAFIPYSVQLGSTTVFVFEPFLFVAAGWAIATHQGPAVARFRGWLLAALLGVAALMGVASQHPPVEIVSDGRGLLTVLLSFVVASRIFGTHYVATSLRVLKYSIWVSLAVVALSMVLKFPMAGRTEAAALFRNSSGAGFSDSTRYLTAASQMSVFVLCACLALCLTERVTLRQAAPYLVPSFALTFLSFSRNSFLAVGVAIVFAIIIARTLKPVIVTARLAIVVGLPLLILGLANAAFGLPGGDFVAVQVQAFSSRVIGGLDSTTLADDTSAIARMNEDAYLFKAIGEAPVFGHGFGYAYRPPVGQAGSFSATKGQYYGHNFYLWITVKTGVLGLIAFLILAAAPVVACLRRRSNEAIALGSAAAGLLLAIAFAPFPNDVSNGGSLAVGLLLGALVAGIAKPATERAPAVHKLPEPALAIR
jgi:O-antigen ligase